MEFQDPEADVVTVCRRKTVLWGSRREYIYSP